MIKIPFIFLPLQILQKLSKGLIGVGDFLSRIFPHLAIQMDQAELRIDHREYLSICFLHDLFLFIFFFIIELMVFSKVEVNHYFIVSLLLSLVPAIFIFFLQVNYPRSIITKRIAGIDRNLLPAMQNLLVQLNSGVPVFNSLVNVSKGDYGALSAEIAKAVREINAGSAEVAALEEIARKNPSRLFRGALWQIVNGMKTGADLSAVLKEILAQIEDQQTLQIQRYGAALNPLAMFYMLLAVIVPSLGMTFLVLISSLVSFGSEITKILFYALFALVIFVQIMFMGVIRSRRPNLLGND